MTIETGDPVPDVTATGMRGDALSLRSVGGGRPFVVYFYPKDDTSGCTREAQDFSDLMPQFGAAGAVVLGVSRDTPARHAKFVAKYGLNVPLASDTDGSVTEAFGTWVEKSMYGRTYMGIERATFLFDAAGRLVRTWRKVKVAGHAAAVLAEVEALR